MMILNNKLCNTAAELRKWSRSVFGKARMQLHMVQEIIFRLDQAQEARVLSEEEAGLLKDLKVRVLGLAAIERARSRQTSRLTWLKHGDACTKFFHLRMSARKRRNFIPALRRRDGTFAWNHDEKEKEAFDHYKTLLGTKVSRARSLNWESKGLNV